MKITKDMAIHLDLYDTENIDLMMDFLFWILITKMYKENEDIIYLHKNTMILIEIPNDYINFFEKFPILTLILQKEEHKMSIKNLEPLIVPNEINSNIQIVCNYLKQRKNNKIDDFDLDFPDITPNDIRNSFLIKKINKKKEKIKTITPAEVLPQKECQQLIFDIIKKKINFPSYYQIKSFIDILSVQLIKFNQSYYLNAFQLQFGKNLKQIRTFIIDNFLNLTYFISEGAFTKLIYENE